MPASIPLSHSAAASGAMPGAAPPTPSFCSDQSTYDIIKVQFDRCAPSSTNKSLSPLSSHTLDVSLSSLSHHYLIVYLLPLSNPYILYHRFSRCAALHVTAKKTPGVVGSYLEVGFDRDPLHMQCWSRWNGDPQRHGDIQAIKD